MDPITISLLIMAAGAMARTVQGGIQMAKGMNQARKAKKLPFPDYTEGLQYLQENQNMYRDNFKTGLGQTTMEGMRTATAAQTAKTMRSLTETSPQFGGQVSSRIASMDRIKTEGIIANMDQQYRQNQLSNMARTASEISSVKMRSVQAQRDYRIMAETAAGEAIKQGSENLVMGIEYTGKMAGKVATGGIA
jgi:hypothetical protein